MRLVDLLAEVDGARLVGDGACEIGAVHDDSRRVAVGDLFVAVPGLTVDGHDFVAAACARGAAAVVVERELSVPVPQIVVGCAKRALGRLAARVAGRPADRMTLVGITGTNGKTTASYLVEAMLAAAHTGARPGVIGTVSFRFGGRETPATFTTPAPVELHALFGDLAARGCSHVVMETSSAALAMDRLEGVVFQVAAFTNLTQDHLDLHGTMAAYRAAKERLFSERLAANGTAVAMVDDGDGIGEAMLAAAPATARKLRVSLRRADNAADISVASATSTIAGLRATLRTPQGEIELASSVLFGEYNLANLALATGIGCALGLDRDAIVAGVRTLPGVPGRVERVANTRGVDLFVDYAHTPDALERVIAALRPLTRGRLLVVFGCGGDRDRAKRPLMGRVVAEGADLAFVTSDNPRTEEPLSILDMIVAGVHAGAARAPHVVEPDRRRAIALAVAEARAGDVVLVAGKGHEDYQIIGTTKHHFDDREEAAAAIARLGSPS
ncbi:MAG: UDP-N-acetylmuramoyl-L-alanyl-D-glutamate--2,6-diaminopimelate ligase [Myxococcales bacterium]|nr:UDP-N-acetylmuramoyl-L-alanyl-D-glutamate--2,6-diaminopimelate ligase [Myxococcales bacterium]